MSKILVVTYSYTGTSRLLGKMLCGMQSWPMAEVRESQPRSGWTGTWRCLMDSFFRRRPAISEIGPTLREYDAVVLISPIWAYRLAGPIRTFVTSNRDQLRDVAVISVMGGSGAPNAVAEIGHLLGRSPLMSTAFTSHEVEDGSCAGRLQAFGQAVQTAEDSSLVMRPATWSPRAA
ncbi:MAG: flavodoxin [Burkholderiales bacterium]|nr:flavodoxin [Burkholderiales bacterium]